MLIAVRQSTDGGVGADPGSGDLHSSAAAESDTRGHFATEEVDHDRRPPAAAAHHSESRISALFQPRTVALHSTRETWYYMNHF